MIEAAVIDNTTLLRVLGLLNTTHALRKMTSESDHSILSENEPLYMSGPPPPVALTRSLSHAERAIDNAMDLISALNIGDSMLINWFYDDKYIDYTLLFKTEKGIHTKDFHCTLDQFRRHWTHAAVGLPPHLLEPSIADRWRS